MVKDEPFSLYYQDIAAPGKEILIDNDVVSYNISEKGDKVIYHKSDETIYESNLEDKKAIGKGIWAMNPEGAKLIYSRNNSLYLNNGASEECIDARAYPIWVSKDLKHVFYCRENNVYHKEEGKPKKLLSSGKAIEIIQGYDTGEMFYTTYSNLGIGSNLYYYDGKQPVLLKNDYVKNYICSPKKPVLLIGTERGIFLAVKGNLTRCDISRHYYNRLNDACTALYYVVFFNGDDDILVKFDIPSMTSTVYDTNVYALHSIEEEDSPVYYINMNPEFYTDQYYIYKNKKKIASHVYGANNFISGNFGYYSTNVKTEHDVNSGFTKSYTCTLNVYNGKDSVKVADNVYINVLAYSENCIFYFLNYNLITDKGDLYYYNGKESKLIDTGVSYLLRNIVPTYGYIEGTYSDLTF